MGNQNTSGIVEQESAENEAPEKARDEVSSPDNTTQENRTRIQENETIKYLDQEIQTADHADSHDPEAETCPPPVDRLTSSEHDEQKGVFNDVESNLDQGNSMINDEIQDQTYTSKGEMQRSGSNSNDPNSTTTSSSDISSHEEAVDMTSEPQEDHDLVAKEIVSCPIETEENLRLSDDVGDDQVEKNEDNSVVDDIASANGPPLGTCNEKDELMISPITTLNGTSSLQDLSASRNECLVLGEEEKLMTNGLGDGDDRSHVDQTQPPDQEIDDPLIRCNDQAEMIVCEIKNEQDEKQDEVTEKVGFVDKVKAEQRMDQREEIKAPIEVNETAVKNVGLAQSEEGSVATAKNQENDHQIETSLFSRQFSTSEFKVSEDEGKKMVDNESNASRAGVQVELRKCPSFDFGVPFDARSEESDQTPLLYQERTTKRSFSTSSTLFQNRGIQTEVLGKSLRYDAVEVEEKTITMERSSSDSSKAPNLNKPDHKEVARAKQRENSNTDHSDMKSSASPSQEDCGTKENGKRKTRPSIFTTCICCTAAIS